MTVNTKTNGITKSLAEISEVSNPNLLDNPDFRVNILGSDIYTSKGSTVSRWNLDNDSSIAVKVHGFGPDQQGGISLTLKKPGALYQKLETPIIGKATLSIKVSKLILGDVPLTVYTGNGSGFLFKEGINIFKFSGTADKPITKIEIRADGVLGPEETSIDIDWVKLELGDNATLFVPPNYNEEYRKLLWYQMPIVNTSRFGYVGTSGKLFIPLPEITQMRLLNPSIMYSNFNINIYANKMSGTIKNEDIKEYFIDNQKELILIFNNADKLINYKGITCSVDFNKSNGISGFLLDAEIY